jgi:putative Mg2+ transporter-C (MgtC) family protein
MEANWQDVISLTVSVILGSIIGYERHIHDKPAGLRTNALICLGSCAFTIISTSLPGADTGRIAAQIITGIGFIGAGSIIQSSGSIHGLTTAAGIWIVAAIGMACGAQMYFIALLAAALTLAVLILLPPIEKKFDNK